MVEALRQSSREKLAVRQSAILALGRIGDADVDPIDKEISRTLIRMTGHAEAQCQRFALVSLAQTGGRPAAPSRCRISDRAPVGSDIPFPPSIALS